MLEGASKRYSCTKSGGRALQATGARGPTVRVFGADRWALGPSCPLFGTQLSGSQLAFNTLDYHGSQAPIWGRTLQALTFPICLEPPKIKNMCCYSFSETREILILWNEFIVCSSGSCRENLKSEQKEQNDKSRD